MPAHTALHAVHLLLHLSGLPPLAQDSEDGAQRSGQTDKPLIKLGVPAKGVCGHSDVAHILDELPQGVLPLLLQLLEVDSALALLGVDGLRALLLAIDLVQARGDAERQTGEPGLLGFTLEALGGLNLADAGGVELAYNVSAFRFTSDWAS